MAAPFATIEDLRKHWPDLPAELETTATTKLAEASLIIRGLYPGIDQRIASGRLDADVVNLVVCQMVATALKRELKAPESDNVQQQSWTAGPYTQAMTFRLQEAELFLSGLHKKLLSGGGKRNQKAFMIVPGR